MYRQNKKNTDSTENATDLFKYALRPDTLNENRCSALYSRNEGLHWHVYLIEMTCSFYYCCYWLTRIGKKSNIFE